MRTAVATVLLIASASTVHAAVINGDFSSGLAGWSWTPDGGAEAAMVATTAAGPFATGDAFRVNPGNNSGTAPQLGGTLSQSLSLTGGVNYTVSGDLGIQNLTGSPNADGGIIRVFLGGTLIHTFDINLIQPSALETDSFSAPFTPGATSNYLLEISFQRGFFNFTPTMYHWADNISVVPAPGAVALLGIGALSVGRRRR